MSDWKFLGRYAVSTYPTNPYREYVITKKNVGGYNVIGYAELNDNQTWSYYEFGPQEKNVATPPEPIFKSTGSTAAEAVTKGMQ